METVDPSKSTGQMFESNKLEAIKNTLAMKVMVKAKKLTIGYDSINTPYSVNPMKKSTTSE